MKKYLLVLLLACCTFIGKAGVHIFRHSSDLIRIEVCKRKEQAIKLSPNPSYNGSLSVVSESKETLHFYVFDVEGTMLFHAMLQPGQERTIAALKKGTYTYDVFRNDEGVEQGKITVL